MTAAQSEILGAPPPQQPNADAGSSPQDSDTCEFFQAIFEPGDLILFRPIETWTENGQKKSRVDYKGIQYALVGGKDQTGQWQPDPERLANTIKRHNERSERTRANIFFGVCPRFGTSGQYDLAWQIRVIRTLWADVDHCTVDEALERCKAAGVPEPSIIVASGNGAHLYWVLTEPYLIDDAADPPPVFTEFIDQGEGKKKKPQRYMKSTDGERVYIDGKNKGNAPSLSPKAQDIQDILGGIASKIGGDHTTDLSRLLRVPRTLNRKDARNGREPVPCRLIELHPERRYAIEDFKRFAEESPHRAAREALAKVRLPAAKPLTPTRQDKLHDLLMACDLAERGSRSEADFALCCWALEHGVTQEVVWAEACNVGKFKEAGERYFALTWGKAEQQTRDRIYQRVRKKVIEGGAKASRDNGNPGDNNDDGEDDLIRQLPGVGNARKQQSTPRIIVGTDESRVVDEAIAALATRADIYQRGGCLVQIIVGSDPPRAIARTKDAPRIHTVRLPRLREMLADSAEWFRPTDEEPERVHPPDWAIKAVDARRQWQNIRPLEAVVETPILRADGTILNHPGYDADTGILFRPETDFPRVPDAPTKDDATEARDAVLEVVADFPFANGAYRSAYFAGLLTPFARYAFNGPAPLFLIDANVRGCGKSLLMDAAAVVATGREMPRMSAPNDDDEFRKRITAVALAGEPLIGLDNLNSILGCDSLDAALTATSWSDRPEGVIWSVAKAEAPGTTGTKGTILSPSRVRTHAHTHENPEGAETSPFSPGSPSSADCFHDWQDTDNGDGMVKRTCRLCGEFYGYLQGAQQ